MIRLLMVLLGSMVAASPWLLATGTWNDVGVWQDSATWNDGV